MGWEAGEGAVGLGGAAGAEGAVEDVAASAEAVKEGGLWPKAANLLPYGMIFLQSVAGGLSSSSSQGISARRPIWVIR